LSKPLDLIDVLIEKQTHLRKMIHGSKSSQEYTNIVNVLESNHLDTIRHIFDSLTEDEQIFLYEEMNRQPLQYVVELSHWYDLMTDWQRNACRIIV
jgi:hypothetical protein